MKIYLIMNRLLHILVVTIVSVLATSCEKELDFKYHYIEPLTVIEGELTPRGVKVGITLTTPMDEPMNRTRLTDAVVTLEDITSGETTVLTPDDEGFFYDPSPGVVGHDYRLVVERDGCHYEAETTMFPPVSIVGLEFNWIKMPYDHVAVLQGQFIDNSDGNDYYWVKLYRNGEIYQWGEMDDRGAVDGILTYFTMTTRMDTDEEEDDSVLFDGDVMTAVVCQITRPMHDYLEALQNDSNGQAMFSGDRCLGYFIASSPVSDSIVFHPDEIPDYN